MALAETAVLAVQLKLEGASQFKSGIAGADAAAASLGKSAAMSSGALSAVGRTAGVVKGSVISLGSAIGGMGRHLKDVVTGPLGMIGLGAGLFAIGGLFKTGIERADEFSFAIEKLQGLTGESADTLSQLIAVTDNYGISADRLVKVVGFAEKAMGNLATNQTALAKFQTQFGFTIVDTTGKTLPFIEVLKKTADFYNSNADQATKAALTAKLFGRSYTDLVPILKLGSKGIQDAADSAKELGITLTETNVRDLAKYRETTRTLGDAITGLQLQIGLGLVPVFTDLAHSITDFLRNGGTQKIVSGFKSVIAVAKDIGAVVTGTVIPALSGFGSAASGFWNAIPAPLRDLLFKGVLADRTIHFLFGISPIQLAAGALDKGLGGLFGTGGFFGRGSPGNPMYVASVTGNLPVTAGTGWASLFALIGPAIAAAVVAKEITNATNQDFAKAGIKTDFMSPGEGVLPFGIESSLHNIGEFFRVWRANPNGLPVQVKGPPINAQGGVAGPYGPMEFNKQGGIGTKPYGPYIDAINKNTMALHQSAGVYRKATQTAYEFAIGQIRHGKLTVKSRSDKGKDWAEVLARDFERSDSTTYRSNANLRSAIKELQRAEIGAHGKARAAITSAIKRMQAVLAARLAQSAATKAPVKDQDTAEAIHATGRVLTGVKSGVSTLKDKTATGLAQVRTATLTGSSRIARVIQANRPIVNTYVNVSATTVQQKTVVVTRYGPTSGDRNGGSLSRGNGP